MQARLSNISSNKQYQQMKRALQEARNRTTLKYQPTKTTTKKQQHEKIRDTEI